MFEGEMESLLAIEATNIIKVPHPYKVYFWYFYFCFLVFCYKSKYFKFKHAL